MCSIEKRRARGKSTRSGMIFVIYDDDLFKMTNFVLKLMNSALKMMKIDSLRQGIEDKEKLVHFIRKYVTGFPMKI